MIKRGLSISTPLVRRYRECQAWLSHFDSIEDKNLNSNPIVWFEIYVQDMARAQKFYEVVLGNKLEPLGDPTDSSIAMMAFPGDREKYGANGALVKMDGAPSGGNSSLIYFGCEDCAVEGGRVASAGGRIEREKMAIGEYGCIVLAVDTEGNMFGLHSMK